MPTSTDKLPDVKNLIVGSFFSSKPDPQRPGTRHASHEVDDYTYLWRSTANLLGLPVILITDSDTEHVSHLESEFFAVRRHTPLNWSTNDERIVAFAAFLRNHDCANVFFTDTGDVVFKKNPFALISEEHPLFVGTDEPSLTKIRHSPFLVHKLFLLNQQLKPEDRFIPSRYFPKILGNPKVVSSNGLYWRVIRRLSRLVRRLLPSHPSCIWEAGVANAGVIGGKREVVKALVDEMARIIESSERGLDLNLNMAVLNYVIWKRKLSPFKGFPLTNEFKCYSTVGGEAIIHK